MGLQWGRSSNSFITSEVGRKAGRHSSLEQTCYNPSPLELQSPSGMEMSPGRNLKNVCVLGEVDAREEETEVRDWMEILEPLLCRKKKVD